MNWVEAGVVPGRKPGFLGGVARRLRIQFGGALYHVINRGNYRRAVFATVGAAQAFETAIAETCERHAWRLHAFAIMPNHYHFALETPQPNLVDGMHWLQSTFSTRFNRFRKERGHLFQGRYQALLVENAAALVRVINYIHLNPVRAKIVLASQCGSFRWGSLRRFVRGTRPTWLCAETLLSQLDLEDSAEGWSRYADYLAELADNPTEQDRQFGDVMSGWAIGTAGWRRSVAREYRHLALQSGYEADEVREIKEQRWKETLAGFLQEAGKCRHDIERDPAEARWKIEMAVRLRHAAVPYRWIGEMLMMGGPSSIRGHVFRSCEHRTA